MYRSAGKILETTVSRKVTLQMKPIGDSIKKIPWSDSPQPKTSHHHYSSVLAPKKQAMWLIFVICSDPIGNFHWGQKIIHPVSKKPVLSANTCFASWENCLTSLFWNQSLFFFKREILNHFSSWIHFRGTTLSSDLFLEIWSSLLEKILFELWYDLSSKVSSDILWSVVIILLRIHANSKPRRHLRYFLISTNAVKTIYNNPFL